MNPSFARRVLATGAALTLAVGAGPAMAAPGHGKGHPNGQGQGAAGGGSQHADPPGNNGTIKIDGEPFDGGHGNDAHVGCRFAITFWGFDRNQAADITFTGQAPTRSSGPLLTEHNVLISTTPAGGGRYDGARYYTAAQLGLSSIAPRKQGWHVRASVDVRQAPGGAKTKVFWIRCAQPSATGGGSASTGSSSASGSATQTSAIQTSAGQSSATPTSAGQSSAGNSTAAQSTALTRSSEGGAAAASLARPGAFTGGGGMTVLTPSAGRAGVATRGRLPFTGLPLLALLLAAAALIGAGTIALRAGRSRRTGY